MTSSTTRSGIDESDEREAVASSALVVERPDPLSVWVVAGCVGG
jgi:hypothetical protein